MACHRELHNLNDARYCHRLSDGEEQKNNNMLDPWLLFFLNLPALIVIILAYIWMGLTEIAAITAVAVNKIPNVVVTIREGVRAMDKKFAANGDNFLFWPVEKTAPYHTAGTGTLHRRRDTFRHRADLEDRTGR